jgi:hypothetical protein
MAEADINRFLTHLALHEKVSASTQNQTLAPLLFLYRVFLPDALARNIPTRRRTGAGNGSFPKNIDGRTPRRAKKDSITFTRRLFNGQSRRPSARRGL